jgi:mRNA interferase RelE/StbE
MKTIRYSAAADKALGRMPTKTAELIEGKIDLLARDPSSLANQVKRLRGSSFLRLRVGDYRVIYTDDFYILDVLDIGSRGGIYE